MGGFANEIPLLLSSLYLSNDGETAPTASADWALRVLGFSVFSDKPTSVGEPSFGDTSQVGSLAGAAHLLHINAGVLRQAQ